MEIGLVVDLSNRVQATLRAAGSLQKIGPLEAKTVQRAIENNNCYILEASSGEIIGCALARPIYDDFFHPDVKDAVERLIRPFHYLHSLMLDPKDQGLGMGAPFVKRILAMMRPKGGTVLLDCWDGSDKLRAFYRAIDFQFVTIMPKPGFKVALFAMATSDIEDTHDHTGSRDQP